MGRREQNVSDLENGRQHFLEDVYSIPLVSTIEEKNQQSKVFLYQAETLCQLLEQTSLSLGLEQDSRLFPVSPLPLEKKPLIYNRQLTHPRQLIRISK